ncbi:MAG: hypothetical protein ABR499_05250 [Gemmatimonadaceae bacterium]
MSDEPTCGKGLAEHSALPAKLAELVAALARNLEIHQDSLDLTDENAKKEYDAYVRLAKEHQAIAAQLRATARHMAGYWDLPMGKHDERALADPRGLEAFESFVRLERELRSLLERSLERDEQMLAAFRGEGTRRA